MSREEERSEYWEVVRSIQNYADKNDLDMDKVLDELDVDLRIL